MDLFKDPQVARAWRQGDGIANWTGLFGAVLLAQVAPINTGRALDLACGAGYPTIDLADRLGPGVEVVGVDTAEEALNVAREAAGDRPNVRFEVADASALPFPDATFALVTCNLGLHLFEDQSTALRECRRVLAPGGQTVFTIPLAGTLDEFWRHFEGVAADRDLLDRIPLATRADEATYVAAFQAAGFADLRPSARWLDFEFPEATALIGRFPPLQMARRRLPEDVREAVWEEVVARIEA
ncbi:MAG TPA: class I SAM-dependent methyltransferase, partial [Dehalococcoidia bacterium]|nr:class I SAM-dependent methyltransferase [Dehalococcoidia bacterium]